MVTDCPEGSSEGGCVHDQVPALVPVWATAPAEAVNETVTPLVSEKVPVMVGAVPSLTLTVELAAVTASGWFGGGPPPPNAHGPDAKNAPNHGAVGPGGHRGPDESRPAQAATDAP